MVLWWQGWRWVLLLLLLLNSRLLASAVVFPIEQNHNKRPFRAINRKPIHGPFGVAGRRVFPLFSLFLYFSREITILFLLFICSSGLFAAQATLFFFSHKGERVCICLMNTFHRQRLSCFSIITAIIIHSIQPSFL